jgi:hypothetical protein
LDFGLGTLAGWQGEGFAMVASNGKDPTKGNWVNSSDREAVKRKALLHRALVVPPGAGVIRFSACAIRAPDCPANENLDVLLLAQGKRVLPKEVRFESDWRRTAHLLPPKGGLAREYIWRISGYAGQTLRIVLIDDDDRPGCYVQCSGFQMVSADEFQAGEFTQFMVDLSDKHKLTPMARYDSPHFIALSNADEEYSKRRLANGELLYSLFADHFQRKGFDLKPPASKLMMAVFDSQAGYDAYLGAKQSPLIIGYYHLATNRFVVYDYGQNEAHLSRKSEAERQGQRIAPYLDRQRYLETVQRVARESRTDVNIRTVMHEVSHQLSWNCGLFNRGGDVPFWVAEGMACYCEPTTNGSWQGIGELNPDRLKFLASVWAGKGSLIPLQELIRRDDWLPPKCDERTTLLAYAQSWALFHMLMQEQPRAVPTYLKLIYPRTISDRRLDDFQQAFGTNLTALEGRHAKYIQDLVEQFGPAKR